LSGNGIDERACWPPSAIGKVASCHHRPSELIRLPAWYGQTGMFLTTHFFGMKINRYMHGHGITERTLARVAAKIPSARRSWPQ
jgi:hypothetical protein